MDVLATTGSAGDTSLHSADQFRARERRSLLSRIGPGPVRNTDEAWLDGLRACAVLLVVVYHVWIYTGRKPWRVLGVDLTSFPVTMGVGVVLFFLLSGYLLSKPWFAAELAGKAGPRLIPFWKRRLARIVPAYWVSIAVVLILFVPSGQIPREAVTGRLGLQNVGGQMLFLQQYFPIASGNLNARNGVYWTLAVEMTFYLLLPLLVLLFIGMRSAFSVVIAPAIALGWTWLSFNSLDPLVAAMRENVTGKEAILGIAANDDYTRGALAQMFPAWTFTFALGIALARLVALHEHCTSEGHRAYWWQHRNVARLALVAGIALFAYAQHRTGKEVLLNVDSNVWRVYMPKILPPLGLVLMMFGLAMHRSVLRRPLEWLPLRYIGWVSFGIYLYHLPILFKLPQDYADTTTRGVLVTLAEVLGLAIAAGTASWLLIERPLLRRRTTPGRSRRLLRPEVLLAGLLVVVAATTAAFVVSETSAAPNTTPVAGMFTTNIPGTRVDPSHSGATTPTSTLKSGMMYPQEVQLLGQCGATRGYRALMVNPAWSVSATVFECRGAEEASSVVAGLVAWEPTTGFKPTGDVSRAHVFFRGDNPAVPTHPAQFHARFANDEWVIGLAIQATSEAAGREAISALIDALGDSYRP